jgi:hypothetical protein
LAVLAARAEYLDKGFDYFADPLKDLLNSFVLKNTSILTT